MKVTRLGLGTVQFGVEYGVANTQGKPTLAVVQELLASARKAGVSLLDTASLYGNSEEILGNCDLTDFDIVTKTPRFDKAVIGSDDVALLQDTFSNSLNQLKKDCVYGLLCHHTPDLLARHGDSLWQAMLTFKAEGRVQKIGASVYKGDEIDRLIDHYPVDIVQLPLNVLDQRLITGGYLDKLNQKGVEVHVRSVFLQGLLLMDQHPNYFKPIENYLDRWQATVEHSQMTRIQAALSFVKSLPGIDCILVGVLDTQQLQECVDGFNQPQHFNGERLACNIDEFMDPSRWVLNHG